MPTFVCPNCRHQNRSGEHFCVACGILLNDTSGGGTGASASAGDTAGSPGSFRLSNTGRRFVVPVLVVILAAVGIPLLWLDHHDGQAGALWQVPTPPKTPTPDLPAPAQAQKNAGVVTAIDKSSASKRLASAHNRNDKKVARAKAAPLDENTPLDDLPAPAAGQPRKSRCIDAQPGVSLCN